MTNKLKTLYGGFVVLIALFAMFLLYVESIPSANSTTQQKKVGSIQTVQEKLANVSVAKDAQKQQVESMPEIAIGVPKIEWFSDDKLRILATSLGFTKDATVQSFGNQYYWHEGVLTLSVDARLGIVTFSTSFNVNNVSSGLGIPTTDQARTAFLGLLAKLEIPTEYYDLSQGTTEYVKPDDTGLISSTSETNGSLLKYNVMYRIQGYEAYLPVETYVIVDPNGKIVSCSLLLINAVVTGKTVPMVSQQTAQSHIDLGGVVIKKNVSSVSTISATHVYPGYYLGQTELYKIGEQRLLIPVYLFTDSSGTVAVSAQK